MGETKMDPEIRPSRMPDAQKPQHMRIAEGSVQPEPVTKVVRLAGTELLPPADVHIRQDKVVGMVSVPSGRTSAPSLSEVSPIGEPPKVQEAQSIPGSAQEAHEVLASNFPSVATSRPLLAPKAAVLLGLAVASCAPGVGAPPQESASPAVQKAPQAQEAVEPGVTVRVAASPTRDEKEKAVGGVPGTPPPGQEIPPGTLSAEVEEEDPGKTATATVEAVVEQESLPEGWKVVFEDKFDSGEHWERIPGVSVEGGKLSVSGEDGSIITYSDLKKLLSGDFKIELDFNPTFGSNGSWSLRLGTHSREEESTKPFYEVVFLRGRVFLLGERGTGETGRVDLKTKAGEGNRLVLERVNGTFKVWVNGMVLEQKEDTLFEDGKVPLGLGFYVSSGSSVAIDNLRVAQGPEPTPTATAEATKVAVGTRPPEPTKPPEATQAPPTATEEAPVAVANEICDLNGVCWERTDKRFGPDLYNPPGRFVVYRHTTDPDYLNWMLGGHVTDIDAADNIVTLDIGRGNTVRVEILFDNRWYMARLQTFEMGEVRKVRPYIRPVLGKDIMVGDYMEVEAGFPGINWQTPEENYEEFVRMGKSGEIILTAALEIWR